MNQIEININIDLHKKWIDDNKCGIRANLKGLDLKGLDLSLVNLPGADLSGCDLSGVNLSGSDLRVTYLSGANLTNANLSGVKLSGSDLTNANLTNAILVETDLTGTILTNAILTNATLKDAILKHTNLIGADLMGANLMGADLDGTNLSGVKNMFDGITYLSENFESDKRGIIAYKTFDGSFRPNPKWKIKKGSVISEACNLNPCDDCGCGINIAPLDWVKTHYHFGQIWKVLIRWEWMVGVVVPYTTTGKIRASRVELIEIITR